MMNHWIIHQTFTVSQIKLIEVEHFFFRWRSCVLIKGGWSSRIWQNKCHVAALKRMRVSKPIIAIRQVFQAHVLLTKFWNLQIFQSRKLVVDERTTPSWVFFLALQAHGSKLRPPRRLHHCFASWCLWTWFWDVQIGDLSPTSQFAERS